MTSGDYVLACSLSRDAEWLYERAERTLSRYFGPQLMSLALIKF